MTDDDSWIDQIKKINTDEVRLPAPASMPKTRSTTDDSARLREDEMMPPFELTDQTSVSFDLHLYALSDSQLLSLDVEKFCRAAERNQKRLRNVSADAIAEHFI